MAAAAILKFTLMATTRSLLNVFAQNVLQKLKEVPKTLLPLDLTFEKIKDGGGRHFENLKAISRKKWLIFA